MYTRKYNNNQHQIHISFTHSNDLRIIDFNRPVWGEILIKMTSIF